MSELWSLAQTCNFRESLESILRDCLLCGMNEVSTQRRLLSKSTLTFQKALEAVQGLEATEWNSQKIQDCGKHGATSALGSLAEDLHQLVANER